jgi:hypothetical protein
MSPVARYETYDLLKKGIGSVTPNGIWTRTTDRVFGGVLGLKQGKCC